jgi:preprotein translocase subunit SecG
MTVFPFLAASFTMNVVAAVFLICAVALILIILIQKGRGGGLSAAFGGGMASGILGSKTGDFLTWVTITLVGVFLMLAVVMAKFYKPAISDFDVGPAQQAPLPQEMPESSEQPLAPAETGSESADTNLLGD